MAEGWGKSLFSKEKFNFYSAGTVKHGLNPRAVSVMKEAGVDISGHISNTVDEFEDVKMDIVFTVCSDANENCPYFPGGKIIHFGFDDPPRLTKEITDEEEILSVYRRVRDEIKSFVEGIEGYING
ncbi:MAG: arsenate reductase [Halobacteriovorax sp. JY17]|nr:MAG: arsenate reductase [Halobacteriovorax sp. JY17]